MMIKKTVKQVKPCDCEAYPFCEHAVKPINKSEATARPWRIGDAGTTVFGPPNGNPSPETVASTTRANARLIVNAVNSFEAMREALESARNWAILKNNMDCVSWLEDVESALKLAEGQKQ